MPKKTSKTVYVCSNCGEEYLQWQGKCGVCGEWNSLKEFNVPVSVSRSPRTGYGSASATALPRKLTEITTGDTARLSTGISEFNRVLGGGLVQGSVILLGGDPGIGKSTLLLQLADRLKEGAVLYVSGEESAEQIKLRADRLGVQAESVHFLTATDVNVVEEQALSLTPKLLIIDSIQTMYDAAFPSTPGSLVQVRESAIRLQRLAKTQGVTIVLVGHITKEGSIAGPRTLEHLVDVVLYLEGDANQEVRVLRAAKNRFGDASETGLFLMEEKGLEEVTNPSSFLLQERVQAPGSVLTVVLEGSRPVLVEVQALTIPTVFGYPRRTASGFDLNRLNLLLAVLQRRAGFDLSNSDVFVNIIGGLKIKDPGLDLAVCTALASAREGVVIDPQLVVVGEVGLAGEVRKVHQQGKRVKEVESLGYAMPKDGRELGTILQAIIKNPFPKAKR